MADDLKLYAEKAHLAAMTEEFRTALGTFIENTNKEVVNMQGAFEHNGITGTDELVSVNKDAFLKNVKEIAKCLDELKSLDEKLVSVEAGYKKFTDKLWEGTV